MSSNEVTQIITIVTAAGTAVTTIFALVSKIKKMLLANQAILAEQIKNVSVQLAEVSHIQDYHLGENGGTPKVHERITRMEAKLDTLLMFVVPQKPESIGVER